jgi:hypothetical protein
MKKIVGGSSVRDLKAAVSDARVKAELLKSRTADANKISHLKALRLAKEAEELISNPQPAAKPVRRKPAMVRSTSGSR